jgi:hypothetical protein
MKYWPLNHRWIWVVLALITTAAIAAGGDPRGWTPGTPAANMPRVLGAEDAELPAIELPNELAKTIKRQSLLVYFSPTCPHCRHVAAELQALSTRIPDTDVIMIASGSSTDGDLAEFKATYNMTTRFYRDNDREVAAAMGARSTPSALLLRPEKKGFQVEAAYYPYTPGTDVIVEMRVSGEPFKNFAPDRFMGTATCASCHQQEAEGWLLTHHSVAWRTLYTRSEQENTECIGCHVTGIGEAGGWHAEDNPELVDVGCEACHSASGPHDGQSIDPKTTCVGCHDEKHSLSFSVERGLPLIDHYRGNKTEESDFLARRKALLGGEAERELLTFADGEYVGSQTCATCHEAQHGGWSASPHGKAMDRLSEGEKANVDCVRCHSTPKEVGPRPTEVSGFQTSEGVGCESCHGPGKAHVTAGGGTANIERLGDDCPVCVIEAVCTSCHTKQWDPQWDLDKDLPRVGHQQPKADD